MPFLIGLVIDTTLIEKRKKNKNLKSKAEISPLLIF